MADRARLEQALIAADKAGDVDAARQLAAALRAVPATVERQPAAYDDEDAKRAQMMRTAREGARQVGRFGRAVAEGGASLPLMLTDAVATPFREGINYVSRLVGGENAPQAIPYQQQFTNALASPEIAPQSAQERVQEDVVQGVTGALSGAGAAQKLALGTTNRFITALAANPGQQAVAGGIAGYAGGQAREAGASPMTQAAANLIGGIGGGAAAGAGVRTLSAGKALLDPFRAGGRELVAGRVLNRAASNPVEARMAIESSSPSPATVPTTGQAAQDAGLAAFESRMRAIEPGQFSQRASTQNAARNALLDTVASGGNSKAIDALVKRRDDVTGPLREQAFKQAAGKAVNSAAILDDIDGLLALPDNQGESVQRALQAIRKQIAGRTRSSTTDGITVEEMEPVTDARALYAIRKEINRILEGRYVDSDESVLRYAGSQLKQVKDSIDNAIGTVAPTWKQYLTKYTQLSRPIDRAETIGDIRKRTSVAAPDLATGQDVISQAKWRQAVGNAMPELQKTLTKGQIQKLQQIGADLDRGAAALAAGRTPGSDTAANLMAQKNMTIANVVGQLVASKNGVADVPAFVTSITKIPSWFTQAADGQVRELIIDAMLDPKLAARLMQKASKQNLDGFLKSLEDNFTRSAAQGAGAAVDDDLNPEMEFLR